MARSVFYYPGSATRAEFDLSKAISQLSEAQVLLEVDRLQKGLHICVYKTPGTELSFKCL